MSHGTLGSLLRLAWPVLVAQLAVVANGVIDTMMAGRFSAVDLAAVGIGASIYVTGKSATYPRHPGEWCQPWPFASSTASCPASAGPGRSWPSTCSVWPRRFRSTSSSCPARGAAGFWLAAAASLLPAGIVVLGDFLHVAAAAIHQDKLPQTTKP